MTAPSDLIRREDVEALIRARQSITQDPMIYAGLSVALQELAALTADPVAEAAGRLAEATHEWYWMPSSGFGSDEKRVAWTFVAAAAESYRAAVAARAKETR